MFTRKSIINQTLRVSWATLLSKALGIIREVLTVNYLGASALSDAFLTAWKIPNSLRKIFAEGALSAAFVPSLVHTVRKEGRASVNKLMLLAIIIFQSLVLLLCLFSWFFLPSLINMFFALLNSLCGYSLAPITS